MDRNEIVEEADKLTRRVQHVSTCIECGAPIYGPLPNLMGLHPDDVTRGVLRTCPRACKFSDHDRGTGRTASGFNHPREY